MLQAYTAGMGTSVRVVVLLGCIAAPSALAQRVPFERTIELASPAALDVSTIRGKIEVVAGPTGRMVVSGAATVRVAWDVPANAEAIAQRVAAAPPIEHAGSTVRLTIPADRDAQRAVTVNYRVEVPPGTRVQTDSNSGETSVRGVAGAVNVRTQSGAIELSGLSGAVQVSTGSGAVTAADVSTALSVTTSSSAITARNVRGSLIVKTQSGRVTVEGRPTADWSTTTSSSSVTFEFARGTGFELDAESRSGSVTVAGASVSGPMTKRSAKGASQGGGPTVRVRTGSGAIRIAVADR